MSVLEAQKLRSRKQEHLDICRTQEVNSTQSAGWDAVRLPHRALPEIDFHKIDTSVSLLGRRHAAPLLISSMTGGSAEGEEVNRLLARLAEAQNIPMGVGSQRVALMNRERGFFKLREVAPKATLWANIGVVQMNYGVDADDCRWIVDALEAQALILHANALQEAIQSEGDRNFSGLFEKISELRRALPREIPLILKETGCGLDAETCRRAVEAGIDALDIAGMGGTHWGFIEGLRHPERRELGEIFRDWGIPTVEALTQARAVVKERVPLIASGGLRHGLDMARALYLGADFCGMALPFLKEASLGFEALESFFHRQIEALKIALFCTGAPSCEELRKMRS